MGEKIAVLTPSRHRPKELWRFYNSIAETVKDPSNVSIKVYIDEDDQDTVGAITEIRRRGGPVEILGFIGRRIIMSHMVNALAKTGTEEIFFFGADDLMMRTADWDEIIISEFSKIPDRIALMYGEDLTTGQHAPDFASHPIIHRNWMNVTGYLTPPIFSCDYADTWLNDIADALNRKIKLPIINEHLHFTVGKAPFDRTYQENRERFSRDNVPLIYHRQDVVEKRREDIKKLRDFINESSA